MISPTLPPTRPDRDFSVLSLNVLLPNGVDGWWIRKMYRPGVPEAHRAWPHRQRLLASLILGIGPDVLCLQETSPASFADDFRFLTEAGYDGEQHGKSMLRPATFWRRDRFERRGSHAHDRVLVTSLATRSGERALYVLNVHLSTGPNPDRRLRQVHDGLERIRKQIARGEGRADAAVLICGDFNSHGPTALRALLSRGEVGADFEEPGHEGPVTSRTRSTALGPFRDVYADAYHPAPPPPTLIVPRQDWMLSRDGPSEALIEALGRMYDTFGPDPWDRSAIDRWLAAINGAPDRGSEHDEVLQIFAETGVEALSREQFVGIYVRALEQGKHWSIEHDLDVCGVPFPPPSPRPFALPLDQMWASPGLVPLAVRPPRPDGGPETALPHGEHPSDHLPLAAVLGWLPYGV